DTETTRVPARPPAAMICNGAEAFVTKMEQKREWRAEVARLVYKQVRSRFDLSLPIQSSVVTSGRPRRPLVFPPAKRSLLDFLGFGRHYTGGRKVVKRQV